MKTLAVILCLFLAGCIEVAGLSPQASISNPVTRDMLYDVENGAIVAVAGLKAYKRSCVELVIPQSCRGTIQNIQRYTRQIPPYLAQLRSFVRNNDQINAVAIYNILQGLLAQAKIPGGQ